jgi:hypothetical protein
LARREAAVETQSTFSLSRGQVSGLVAAWILISPAAWAQSDDARAVRSTAEIASAARNETNVGGRSREEFTKPPSTGQNVWARIQIPDRVTAHLTRQALDRAWSLLAKPRCRSLLTEFADREHRPLSARLAALGVDVQTYLTLVVFIDDARNHKCVAGVIGFTVPGSRVVRLCGAELQRAWQSDSKHLVGALIHEMLHTLGLGENPPSSNEITRLVLGRCHEE